MGPMVLSPVIYLDSWVVLATVASYCWMPRITKAAGEEKYYAIRMYNPASPKRTLQASHRCDSFLKWGYP